MDKQKLPLTSSLAWRLFLMTFVVIAGLVFIGSTSQAQTADGWTPAEETVCDGQSGALWGLCVAYCEAMDCDSDYPNADETACNQVLGNYMDKALRLEADNEMPPCWPPEPAGAASTDDSAGEDGSGSSEPSA